MSNQKTNYWDGLNLNNMKTINYKYVPFLMFIFAFSLNSCTKDEETLDNSNADFTLFAKSLADAGSKMYIDKELILANEEAFLEAVSNNTLFENSENITFEEFGDVFQDYFGVDKKQTIFFLETVNSNKHLLEEPNGRELLEQALISEINNREESQEKWLFRSILSAVGGEHSCGTRIMASFLDTAILATTTIVTAPTGVGAVVAGIGTASAYGLLVVEVARCS